MALTWVVLFASQITKKSATASGIFRKSRAIMFSPFFSRIAFIIDLKIFELRLSFTTLVFLRSAKTDKGANNQPIYSEKF